MYAHFRRAYVTERTAILPAYKKGAERCHRRRCASAIRALPSAVFGPVLMPPWNLQRLRPGSLLARHGVPFRVLAPQITRFGRGGLGYQEGKGAAGINRDVPKTPPRARIRCAENHQSERLRNSLRSPPARIDQHLALPVLNGVLMDARPLGQGTPGKLRPQAMRL